MASLPAGAGQILRRTALALSAVVLASVVLAFWYTWPSSSCPGNARSDRLSAFRVLGLLATTREGRAELVRLGHRPRVCFAHVRDGVLQDGAALILPIAHSDRMNAARVAHLLLHEIDGAPLDERAARLRSAPCAELVQSAIRRESSSYAAEERVGEALGISLPSLPPPLLETAYRIRCRALSTEGGP